MALPKEIVFQTPPVGIVTIQSGQMGYKRRVNIRLKRNKKGDVYCITKHGAVYVKLPNSKTKKKKK